MKVGPASGFPDRVKFRLFVDARKAGPFILITEPYGREIPVDPGNWVDVECVNNDGTPAEIWIQPDGSIAVHGREVIVTDEHGNERVY
jgi:hypothetical protein